MFYTVTLEPDENGTVIASVDGIPEAVTVGRSREEALARVEDALIAALRGYIEDGRALPESRRPRRSRLTVGLPPVAAAKLALYSSMLSAGKTARDLAITLGRPENYVEGLLNLDRRSDMDEIEAALAVLGKRLEIGAVDAA